MPHKRKRLDIVAEILGIRSIDRRPVVEQPQGNAVPTSSAGGTAIGESSLGHRSPGTVQDCHVLPKPRAPGPVAELDRGVGIVEANRQQCDLGVDSRGGVPIPRQRAGLFERAPACVDASLRHQTLDQDDVVFVDKLIGFDQWRQQLRHLDGGAVAGHGMCAANVPQHGIPCGQFGGALHRGSPETEDVPASRRDARRESQHIDDLALTPPGKPPVERSGNGS